MNDLEELREDIRRYRQRVNERLDELERRIAGTEKVSERVLRFMQGDADFKDKGMVDRLADFAAFMGEMKGFDFKKMNEFATEYDEFKRRFLWLTAGILGLSTALAGILTNLDKIQKFFHH